MGNTRAQEAGDSQKNWLFDFFFLIFFNYRGTSCFLCGGGQNSLAEKAPFSVCVF